MVARCLQCYTSAHCCAVATPAALHLHCCSWWKLHCTLGFMLNAVRRSSAGQHMQQMHDPHFRQRAAAATYVLTICVGHCCAVHLLAVLLQ
jgi:hypothetical protein